MILFWILLIVVMIAVELGTTALVSIWFVGGGLAALAAACLHLHLWLQISIFFFVSAALFLTCRSWLETRFKPIIQPTNLSLLKNSIGTVTETVDPVRGGRVLVKGQDWKAVSLTGETIPKDSLVKVSEIQGVKLVVFPVPKHPPLP